jgi:hypothetical protein
MPQLWLVDIMELSNQMQGHVVTWYCSDHMIIGCKLLFIKIRIFHTKLSRQHYWGHWSVQNFHFAKYFLSFSTSPTVFLNWARSTSRC